MALREPPELPARKDVLRLQKKKKLSSSYRDLFAKTDIDSDGTLSEGEVATLLTTHGIDASVAYVRQLFEVFDTDGSGTISGPEFECIWKMLNLQAIEGEVTPAVTPTFERSLIDSALRESTAANDVDVEAGNAKVTDRLFATGKREAERLEIDAKFRKYDEDHRGTLSRAEVENAFATEGMRLASTDDMQFFDEMWRAFDVDKSNDIDREEFTAMYRMMKMHHTQRLAEQRCGPVKMVTIHRCVIISGTILFMLALLVLLVGMTSCDTGTPLRGGTDATERRILQAAGAKAHALIENEHVTGIVSFQQSGDKLAVSAQLQYTDGTAETTTQHSWHVHTDPSEERADCASSGVCSCAGGHYDPTGLETASYACDSSTDHTECYRGDLTGKLGQLSVFGRTGSDNFLQIGDLIGRSIVIHADAGAASRIACGNIVRTAATRGGVHALINTATISGRVQFTAGPGDRTDISIHLRYKDSTSATTSGHSWHVHEDLVGDSTDCAEAGAHYDPTNKEVAPYTCDPAAPSECYVGDMSGKHGTVTVTGQVGEDHMLTINELVGKSVVIHASNSGLRIACGTINGGGAHEQVRPCGPEPSPTPRAMDASLCGESGNHHCYFGGSCMDVAPAVCQISGTSHDLLFQVLPSAFLSSLIDIPTDRISTLRGPTLRHV
jgi:Ca2+-binding EF-hand superfamily protein/Cu/Zn superoxide dismutase